MPVPGQPRNPDRERLDRFHGRPHISIAFPGRSPGMMETSLRGNVLAPGQIRRLWRQSINYLAAQSPFSTTANAPGPGRPSFTEHPFQVTRALRYMTRSVYAGAGIGSTRLSELHTSVKPRARGKAVSIAAGSKRSQPTVRNRLTSFGSRVPALNDPSTAAEKK